MPKISRGVIITAYSGKHNGKSSASALFFRAFVLTLSATALILIGYFAVGFFFGGF